jgi:hypothetical protein
MVVVILTTHPHIPIPPFTHMLWYIVVFRVLFLVSYTILSTHLIYSYPLTHPPTHPHALKIRHFPSPPLVRDGVPRTQPATPSYLGGGALRVGNAGLEALQESTVWVGGGVMDVCVTQDVFELSLTLLNLEHYASHRSSSPLTLPPSSYCHVVTYCSVSHSLSYPLHHSLLTAHLFIPTTHPPTHLRAEADSNTRSTLDP